MKSCCKPTDTRSMHFKTHMGLTQSFSHKLTKEILFLEFRLFKHAQVCCTISVCSTIPSYQLALSNVDSGLMDNLGL